LDDDIVANNFAIHFQNASSSSNFTQTNLNNRANTISSFIRDNLTNSTLNDYLIEDGKLINQPFNISEFNEVLKKANLNSAPGSDDITYSFIKHAPYHTTRFILDLINKSWDS